MDGCATARPGKYASRYITAAHRQIPVDMLGLATGVRPVLVATNRRPMRIYAKMETLIGFDRNGESGAVVPNSPILSNLHTWAYSQGLRN